MKLSVVIPVLNEEAHIGVCLESVRAQEEINDIVVVDGGSGDETVTRASAVPGVVVISAQRGRASQLNAGAERAEGDTILFLHADVRLPESASALVEDVLSVPGTVAGAFRTWHTAEKRTSRIAKMLLHLADLRSRYSPLPYGDQALFLRREWFDRVGGFPDQALMEDLEMSRRLSKHGTIGIAPASVSVSGRRFEGAPLYQAVLVNTFPLLYYLGVPAAVLARLYGNPR